MRLWPFRRDLNPDPKGFNQALRRSVDVDRHGPVDVARDFRRVFVRDDDGAGKRVLFMLMTWCGEYGIDTPSDPNELQRWAGRREIAGKIKAALYADLTELE